MTTIGCSDRCYEPTVSQICHSKTYYIFISAVYTTPARADFACMSTRSHHSHSPVINPTAITVGGRTSQAFYHEHFPANLCLARLLTLSSDKIRKRSASTRTRKQPTDQSPKDRMHETNNSDANDTIAITAQCGLSFKGRSSPV